MSAPEPDAAWQPEDDNPASLVGNDVDDNDRGDFPEDAQFTDEQWAHLERVRVGGGAGG